MECKAIITYAGVLNPSLESHIAAAIPLDSCEWRRSYGRPIKDVKVEAKFQKFNIDILNRYRKGEWSILEHPVLHMFVTECSDVESYKTTVKEEIESWIKILNGFGIGDWMILLVETFDVKKSKNILPRTTVLDKMRLDFGSKHADRCISVLNPLKNELKATESFRCLLQRIRHLLLVGYNKNITKYEELIRANREKRNHEGWSFIRYFLLQEQLAFVLEMLGLHMEALVQYDELDAMLSQFILNNSFGEKPIWLEIFEQQLNAFHGITLNSKKIFATRKKIVNNTVNLLEFRSYVFERQTVLLGAADHPWEIAERLLPFLFSTLREINALKVDAPEGALACWQFVCALEVLALCDQAVETKNITMVFQHAAPIWNLAKDKLYELGKLCGLLPGFTPTSAQLHTVVQLSAGIGDSLLDEEAVLVDKPVNDTERPVHSPNRKPKQSATDRLKEALGSNNSFQRLYLELSELAISTYKHVSRLRSARLVGLDLGNFYCTLSEPNKAVVFFTDLLRELKSENWSYLASQTLLELASCYRKMNDTVAYTKTCAAISCCLDLEILVRTFYFDEFLVSLRQLNEELKNKNEDGSTDMAVTVLEDHFKVLGISIKKEGQIIQDEYICVEIKFESEFPREIVSELVSLSFELQSKQNTNELVPRTGQFSFGSMLSMSSHLDLKQDNTLNCASVVFNNKDKQPIRRSSSTRRKISPTMRTDFTNSVSCSNVAIKPGLNICELKCKATRVGIWNFKQMSVVFNSLEFLSETLLSIKTHPFEIITKPTSAILNFKNLVAGIVQPIKLIISGGSFIFPKNSAINLKCSKGLKMRSFDDNGPEEDFRTEVNLPLIDFKSFEERTIPLEVICDLPGKKDDKLMEHKVSLHCPWSRNELLIPIHFIPPLNASCRLHSSETRKFLQVIIRGIESRLNLSDAKMTCDCKGVNLKYKNPASQSNVVIYKGLNVSYIWEIEVEPLKAECELNVINVNFSLQYAHVDDLERKRKFSCKFDVRDYTTLFRIQAKIEPSELCRVGLLCNLNLRITKMQENKFNELKYEVLTDQNTWALCGPKTGVISMQDISSQSIMLDILPLSAGFLPMPNIRLSKYISVDKSKVDMQFPPGQIYNSTKSMQIHVLANNNTE